MVAVAEVVAEILESLRCAVGTTSTCHSRGATTVKQMTILAKEEVADATTTTHQVQDTAVEAA